MRNNLTVKDKTSITDNTCIIRAVAENEFKCKIDLTDGCHNVRIEEDSEKYTSFNTPFGTYRTRVMQ